jgi:diadenosine tetraphosphate (Ap4A) HIT family hydrolase
MNETSCVFCSRKENIFIDNPQTYSTLNISPATPGHFLVVPKDHITVLSELEGYVYTELFKTIEMTYQRICGEIQR